MNFKDKLVNPRKKSVKEHSKKAIISYSKGVFYAVTRKETYPVLGNGKLTRDDVFIYAKPNNDKRETWEKTEFNPKGKRLDIISKYWSNIRDGMRVKGIIVDNKFKIL